MNCIMTTLYASAVWASMNRLILYGWGRTLSPKALGYLVLSTIFVFMVTLLALALTLAAVE